MVSSTTVVGGATGDYAGNHGDPSPGAVGAATDYFYPGNGNGIIVTSRGVCDKDGTLTGNWLDQVSFKSVLDGTSNTFLMGEMHIPKGGLNTTPFNGPMFNGLELVAHSRIGGPGVPILSTNDEPGFLFGFGSAHPGICNFVLGDGSTRSIKNSLDTLVLGDLCNRHDGNVVSADD